MRRNTVWCFGLLLGWLAGLSVCAHAQFYFGRNKIQYEKFNWQVLTTPHFHIFYYPEESALAQAAACFAETAFDEYEIRFNHTINQMIPLFIYSNHIHFQQTNILTALIPEGVGGFFEFIKQRVVLPYNGNMSDFRHVIRHELVHVFTYQKIHSVTRDLGIWETAGFPLWFFEGLAELWSQGWDSQAELIIRDAVLHDYIYPLNSFELLSSGFLLYKEAQSFLGWYEETYGIDRLRLVMETYWQYPNFEKTMEAVSGKLFRDIETEWRMALKRRFAKDLAVEALMPVGGSMLTKTGINLSPAYFRDPSGSEQLAFLTNRDGYTDIYRMHLEDRRQQTVVRGERRADKESLHFMQSGVHVSSTGQLVYVSKSGSRDAIRVVELHSGSETASLQLDSLVSIYSPKWSPDGCKIIFEAQDFSGFSDLYLWNTVSAVVTRLTRDIYSDKEPCFDPGGQAVVFSSDRARPGPDGAMNLFKLDIQSGQLLQLTFSDCKDVKPIWLPGHPDDILFLSDRSGTMNAWSLQSRTAADGAPECSVRQLTGFHTGLQDLATIHGDSLLTSAFQRYSFQLFHVPIDTNRTPEPAYCARHYEGREGWQLPSAGHYTGLERRPYRLKYSLDFAQTAVAYDPIYGFLGGAQLSISDLLGNRYYHFLVMNTAETSSDLLDRFNVAVTLVDLSRRSNRAIGFFRFANDYYNPYEGYYFERIVGIRGAVNYPIDVFRRLEFSLSAWQSQKQHLFETSQESWLISNYISYVHDNSLWTYTGPIDGWCLRITLGPTYDFKRSQLHNYTALADFRYYWRLHRYCTFAQRSIVWYNDGRDIRRFYIGGSWGLRGYRITEVYGRKYFLLNHELRFPFAQSLTLRFGETSIGLAPIRSAIFLDLGNAWDYTYPGLRGSFGVGLRGVLFGGLVLRLDAGKRTNFRGLEPGLFWQFFFGWDY